MMSVTSVAALLDGVVPCVLALVLTAAVGDVRRRNISNRLILIFLLPGLLFGTLTYGNFWLLVSLATGFLILLGLFPLFLMGALGAGDVKLLAAIGSLVGAEAFGTILLDSLIAGFVIGAFIWWRRDVLVASDNLPLPAAGDNETLSVRSAEKIFSVPFGLAIALATLWALYGDFLMASLSHTFQPWLAILRASL